MTPTQPRDDDRDFAQLTGAFDRPIAPSPSFAERLRSQVHAAERSRPAMTPPTPITAQRAPVRITHAPASRKRRWKGAHLLEVAAAVLLVAAMAFGAFFLNVRRSDDAPETSRLAALASPEASAMPASDAVALSRMNGPAWYFPAPAFDATSYTLSTLVDDQRYTIRSIQAYGDYLVQTGDFSEGDYGDTHHSLLWVTDASTGDVLWDTSEHFIPNIAIANDTVYGVQVSTMGDRVIAKLVAMSLPTGKRLFSEPVLLVAEGPDGEGLGPVVVGDTVYVADTMGTTYALDATTGEQRWVSEGEKRVTPMANGLTYTAGGSMVADGDALFVVTGDNTIRKLQRSDGSTIEGFEIASGVDFETSLITLYHTGDALIARAQGDPTSGSDGGAVQMTPETLVSLDPATGEINWSRPLPEIAGNIIVMDDLIIVPVRPAKTDPIELQLMNTFEGSWFSGGNVAHISDLSTARTVAISATGSHETLLMLDSDGLLQVLDLSPHFVTVQSTNVRSTPGEGALPPPVVLNGKVYVANEAGRIIVLTPNE